MQHEQFRRQRTDERIALATQPRQRDRAQCALAPVSTHLMVVAEISSVLRQQRFTGFRWQVTVILLCVLAKPLGQYVVDILVAKGHAALHPWVHTLGRHVIEQCHAAGIAVNTWTCDDPDRMRELASWGIDGICTNVPDVALEVLGR